MGVSIQNSSGLLNLEERTSGDIDCPQMMFLKKKS
jgi:hypothetical protein